MAKAADEEEDIGTAGTKGAMSYPGNRCLYATGQEEAQNSLATRATGTNTE